MIFNTQMLSISDPQEDFVRQEVEGVIDRSNLSFKGSTNDFYKILQGSLGRIKGILEHFWVGIEPHWIRTATELNTFFGNLKQINGLNALRAIRLKDHLTFLASNTESVATVLNKQLAILEPLMAAAEGAMTTATTNAISNEGFTSVQFTNQDSVFNNGLSLNTAEGCLSVPFVENSDIPFVPLSDTSLQVSGAPLVVKTGDNSFIQTEQLFTSGYYFGKFLDNAPVFRSRPQVSNLSADDDTTLYVESYDDANMRVAISFLFLNPAQTIGTLNLQFGKCSSFPVVAQLLVKRTDASTYEDITDRIFSRGISYRGAAQQTNNRTVKPGNNQSFPLLLLVLNESNVQELKIVLDIPISQEVEFQEYTLLDAEDKVTRTFNYFESLFISNFAFGSDFTVQTAGINSDDIQRALATGKVVATHRTIRKRFAAIRAISFKTMQTAQKGEYVSKFYGTGHEIQAVELLANELIPVGLSNRSIRYYLSTDGNAFVEIWPLNRSPSAQIKNRLVFDPRDPLREDVPSTGRVRLKIQMDNGGSGLIPKCHGFMLRIKETFGI